MLEVVQLPILADNYVYVLHDTEAGATAVVDPGLAEPVLEILAQRHWQLDYILNTHHHWDHVGGNLELQQMTGCTIIGGTGDENRIPGLTQTVQEGDVLWLGHERIEVIAVPGHTLHHVVYYLPDAQSLFCGDTLFVMGCGRLFEGTAEQLWQSLQKFKAMPGATKLYCTHEYTQKNGQFALTLEPDNMDLQTKMLKVNTLRQQSLPTVPSSLAEEWATNPFLRETYLQPKFKNLSPVQVFAEIRRLKDNF
jgi:hydroxyacylglutathione hydrolase